MELFSGYFVHPDEKFHKKLIAWILANRSSFSLAFYLSIILHSAGDIPGHEGRCQSDF
jgi:hypothetical protein